MKTINQQVFLSCACFKHLPLPLSLSLSLSLGTCGVRLEAVVEPAATVCRRGSCRTRCCLADRQSGAPARSVPAQLSGQQIPEYKDCYYQQLPQCVGEEAAVQDAFCLTASQQLQLVLCLPSCQVNRYLNVQIVTTSSFHSVLERKLLAKC